MSSIVEKALGKLFGSKSDKDIKSVYPIVEQIKAEYEKLKNVSDQELRSATDSIRERINKHLAEIDNKIATLNKKAKDNPDLNIDEKEALYEEVDKLEEERNRELEVVLNEVLPLGFAVVRETARRWKENEKLVVKATMFDKQIAAKRKGVEIDGENAIWYNEWEAAGATVKWDMVHYDVQLIGGIVLHQGKIAEMATGEGKTLVATLPCYLNALANRGVHLVTVNNYLAKRDSQWMGPLFEFHGLKVDCIDLHRPNSQERRDAYQADITFGTNNEFGFDYLRDNISMEPNDLVQRKHHYAIVDEVDSVLIDEARTPLIISGPVPKGDQHQFDPLKPRVITLYDAQKKIVSNYLNEAKKLIKEGKEKEGGLPLLRAFRGLPKNKPLIKFLSEPGMRALLQKTENYYLQDNAREMPTVDEPLYFTIDEKQNQVELKEKGIELITKEGEDQDFFVLPDIGEEMAKLEKDTDLSDEEKIEKKNDLIQNYSAKSERIHTVNQLLKAYTLFEKDVDYILQNSKVQIVDEHTGRVLDGRRYSDGLHQAIEAKENVKIEEATQTYATVTLQNYFRMYHKLSGMTGTAETEAGEFWEIYELDVVVIPTNRPIVRKDLQDKVFKTMREKFNAVAEEIEALRMQKRPILVGTTSVEVSEVLSRMLKMKGIDHNVLNAKQHQSEAEIVAEAGKPGKVTIATNMAGRGTDIKLPKESKDAGGLAIIGTERHDARRVDRQLRGRSGRQGDPGSSQFFVSLEDNLMRLFGSERIAKVMDRMGLGEGEVIQHSMVTKSIERAQKKVEENNFSIRKRLLEYDNVMNSQREVIYKRRKNALFGERLQVDIMNMVYELSEVMVNNAKATENLDELRLGSISMFGTDPGIKAEAFEKTATQDLVIDLYNKAYGNYTSKNKNVASNALPLLKNVFETRGATVENIVVPFTDGNKQIAVTTNLKESVESEGRSMIVSMEKLLSLIVIDQAWKEHLREMDDLRQSVQMAVHEQKDPLLIYKFEAFEMFKKLIAKINEETVSFLMKADIPVQNPEEMREAGGRRKSAQNYEEQKEEARSLASSGGGAQPQNQDTRQNREPVAPVKSDKVYGRNDRVTVQYVDGNLKKDVKYKVVEEDIKNNKCVLVED